MEIYVGNLPATVSDEELRSLFEKFGTVQAATVGRDKKTGESQGYGFVEMPVKAEVRAAIDGLRGKEMDGKPLRVKVLKPGDEFHSHAQNLHGAAGMKGVKPQRVDPGFRGSGAIRRGGQRGS
jgi:RNA recognition motif-containing protein